MTSEEVYALYGKIVLMAGGSCLHWQQSDLEKAVNLCKLLAIDSLTVKVADGAQVWHSPETYKQWRAYALSQGVGLVPFSYCYTRQQFGADQLQAQANLIRSFMEVNDNAGMVIDMETEFDGKATEATAFAALLHHLPGPLIVSTWANPKEHAYTGVIQALEPVAAGFGPQQYTNYLASQESQYPAGLVLLPEIDLVNSFGPDNQLAIARQARSRGHNSLWLWAYEYAAGRHTLIQELASIMKSDAPPPSPAPAPAQTYKVVYGDSLWSIAAHFYGDGSKYPEIYQANAGEIGPNPDIIRVGMTLKIPAL